MSFDFLGGLLGGFFKLTVTAEQNLSLALFFIRLQSTECIDGTRLIDLDAARKLKAGPLTDVEGAADGP